MDKAFVIDPNPAILKTLDLFGPCVHLLETQALDPDVGSHASDVFGICRPAYFLVMFCAAVAVVYDNWLWTERPEFFQGSDEIADNLETTTVLAAEFGS
jgi:hypothetical protein